MTAHPLPLRRILNSNQQLARLLQQAEENRRNLEWIRGALPADLATHLREASVENGTLVLLTASPVWASRLRYAGPKLKAALNFDGEIRVKVLPSGSAAPPPNRKPKRPRAEALSTENAKRIRTMAAAINDPGLSGALTRLAALGSEKR